MPSNLCNVPEKSAALNENPPSNGPLFGIIPRWVAALNLTGREYRVLHIIAGHAQRKSRLAKFTIETIGSEGKLDRRHVQRAIRRLQAKGIIIVHGGGGRSWDDALAATKLIVIDEQTARHRIADMDRPAEYTDGHPPEAFWRTLWKINRACGLDVPADVFFPEDHAAALQRIDPAAGAMLADASAVMKREFEQKFWAERAAKGWLVPAPQSQPPAAPEIKEEERKQ